MNAQALIALAERCEAATGPDRELEISIWELVAPRTFQRHFWDLKASQSKGDPDADAKARSRMRPPAFTASLDAAMTLIDWASLKEWGYRFTLEQDDFSDAWNARIDQLCDGGDTIIATAATRELATTALALKARADSETPNHPPSKGHP